MCLLFCLLFCWICVLCVCVCCEYMCISSLIKVLLSNWPFEWHQQYKYTLPWPFWHSYRLQSENSTRSNLSLSQRCFIDFNKWTHCKLHLHCIFLILFIIIWIARNKVNVDSVTENSKATARSFIFTWLLQWDAIKLHFHFERLIYSASVLSTFYFTYFAPYTHTQISSNISSSPNLSKEEQFTIMFSFVTTVILFFIIVFISFAVKIKCELKYNRQFQTICLGLNLLHCIFFCVCFVFCSSWWWKYPHLIEFI